MRRNTFHKFRGNKKLGMQHIQAVFFDTETYPEEVEIDIKKLTLKLGTGLHWIRDLDYVERFDFYKGKTFWDKVEKIALNSKHLFLIAHNTDFDFTTTNGYNELFVKRGWTQDSFYIKGMVYIIRLHKGKHKITIVDGTNYFPMELKKLGKSIGLNKLEINFKTCSMEELLVYCRRDTEIIYKAIKEFIQFLEDNDLTKFKTTISSLALNIFRHKFYDIKKPIFVHTWRQALQLERNAYRGGITDCLKVGRFRNKLYKLDVNSMYPSIMKTKDLPRKLLTYRSRKHATPGELLQLLYKNLDSNILTIARVKIKLPVKYGYILTKAYVDKEKKALFLSGTYEIVIPTPELEFVRKYGEILEVYQVTSYEKSNLFKDYVDYFYKLRQQAKRDGNDMMDLFTKSITTNIYGKLAQRKINYTKTGTSKTSCVQSRNIYTCDKSGDPIVETETQFGHDIFTMTKSKELSYDSFQPIPVFITSYARMKLVSYILQAERKHSYYLDTDCIIVNQTGYNNLKDEIHPTELGMLKVEETSMDSTFIRPKWYIFNEKRKCKGIRKNAIMLEDNKEKTVYSQEQFERHKTKLKKGHLDSQFVYTIQKELSKDYDKGLVVGQDVFVYEVDSG